ncbi:glycosyl transferase family 1, partial [Staphylococcus hominis]
NMYDYFQEATQVTINIESINSKNWLHDWQHDCGYTIKYVEHSNDVRVYDGNNFIMYAHFTDETYKKLDYLNYFDTSRRKIKRVLYD